HHRRHHGQPRQRERPHAGGGRRVRVCGHHIEPYAAPATRHSKLGERPCDPALRNRTTPSSYSESPSASTCVGAWIWLKMLSNNTGLLLSRPRICVQKGLSRSEDSV